MRVESSVLAEAPDATKANSKENNNFERTRKTPDGIVQKFKHNRFPQKRGYFMRARTGAFADLPGRLPDSSTGYGLNASPRHHWRDGFCR